MSLLINGMGVSPGISIGPAHMVHRNTLDVVQQELPPERVEKEVRRFSTALQSAKEYLNQVKRSMDDAPPDVAILIDSHILMLEDAMLGQEPIDAIRAQRCNAEWAIQQRQNLLMETFMGIEDDYLRSRGNDVEHVVGLILRFLDDKDYAEKKAEQNLQGCIIVADDLTPADTIVFQNQKIGGFVTELGGPTSHTAILAHSLRIPAVVAAHNVRKLIKDGERVILDGNNGAVVADLDVQLVREYRKKQKREHERRQQLALLRNKKAVTQDGVEIRLLANIDLTEDLRTLKRSGAIGVGLYRTEFFYLNREKIIDENEQVQIYRKVLRVMDGMPVTIRTLDLGGEKEFDPTYERPLAPNPALGLRAIRRSLHEPEAFLCQLRAILRASAYGSVRVLLPMLTSMQELEQTLELLDVAKRQLRAQKKQYAEHVPVGGMIEVPAAALQANQFAGRLDFLSLGTNDLIQYTLAIDRIDDEVNYLYDPLHPGVLKLIQMVIQAGENNGKPVAMCGEMAGDTRYIPLLLGLGLREFSAHPSTLPEVKEVILNSHAERLKKKCRRILNAEAKKIPAMVAALKPSRKQP